MTVNESVATSNRRFEQFLVLIFLALPPIGGLVILANALQNPAKFWMTVGWLALLVAVVGAHIKWVRPYFRRFPWVKSYGELAEATRLINGAHPKVVRQAWRSRILRSLYRIGVAAAIAPSLIGLYLLHGHHFVWFLAGYAVCGFGITIGYHRIGTHPSFKAPNWLRGTLLTMGSMAMQGPASEWLKKHSKHHAFGETTADVHSPYVFEESKRAIFVEQVHAFLHSFMMWAFREPSLTRPRGMSVESWKEHLLANPPDPRTFAFREEDRFHWEVTDKNGKVIVTTESLIKKRWNKLVDTIIKIETDPVVKFVSNPIFYVGALVVSVAAPWYLGGITVWESLARICFLNWVTFCVNSVCHIWGEQPFRTPDNSRNNAVVEILGLGEGGHNTHHKAELWAQHGIFAWQFDPSAVIIKTFGKLGLATDIKLPTRQQVVQAWIQWRHREPEMQGYPVRVHPPTQAVVSAPAVPVGVGPD